ncbi:MAG TPA: hypothetical protein VE338_06380 [Ktedonobacterales bacterium]|jgi:hypothetical protein|nr:hypothetical protein [Ktedonobacterales bacterium]
MARDSRSIEINPDASDPTTARERMRILPYIWVTLFAIAACVIGIFIAAIPLRYAQALDSCSGAHCDLSAMYTVALDIITALVWFAMALLVFWRRPGDRLGLFTALTLLTFGIGRFPDTPLALSAAHPEWWLPVQTLRFLGSACLSIFVFVFPDSRFVPPITRWFAAAWIIMQVPEFFLTSSRASADTWSPALRFAGFLGFTLVVVAAQTWRYQRVSTAGQRQQTRWVVFGFGSALACYLILALGYPLAAASGVVSAPPLLVSSLTSLTFLFIPVSLAIAVIRYRLFDVDTLINRALVYGSLSVSLAAMYFASIFVLQLVIVLITGTRQVSSVVVVCSTLGVAAIVQPLRRSLQRGIDRRFYRRKYDANATIAAFSASLRQVVDLADLREHLLDVAHDTMQPTHASLWLRTTTRQDAFGDV